MGKKKQKRSKKTINLKVKLQNQNKLLMDEDDNHLLIEYDIASSMKAIDINWQAYHVVGK